MHLKTKINSLYFTFLLLKQIPSIINMKTKTADTLCAMLLLRFKLLLPHKRLFQFMLQQFEVKLDYIKFIFKH